MLLAMLSSCTKQTIIVSNTPYDVVPIKKTSICLSRNRTGGYVRCKFVPMA